METIKKCSSKKHEDNAISYCEICKVYMCEKCSNLHSQLFDQHQINLMNNMDPMNNINPMNKMNNINPMNNNLNQMDIMFNMNMTYNPMNFNPLGSMNNINQFQLNQMMNEFGMNNCNNFNKMPLDLMTKQMLLQENAQNQINYKGNMINQISNNYISNNFLKKRDIEEFKINLHSNIQPRKEYSFKPLIYNFINNNINLYRCSMNLDKKIEMTDHPVLTSYYLAFLDHYPVVLSPDILWMLILEGFSQHVRLNSKKLREKFIKNKQDKGTIVITQEVKGDEHINDVSTKKWGDIFKYFIEKSKEYIDGAILHLFTPYFSTTTDDIEYSSQIAIISIISPFVKYITKFRYDITGACGFPYINLQGTLKDYKQLKMKIEGLKGYLIDDWINKIIPIIDKIIETKKGIIDKQFWDNMITNQKRVYLDKIMEGSSASYKTVEKEEINIFGWIFDFFPFKKKREVGAKIISNQIIFKNTLIRNDIKVYKDSNFAELPEEMINIHATYENRNGQKAKLGIKTGFLGYSLNEKNEFQPEIGWYFYIKDDPHELIQKII